MTFQVLRRDQPIHGHRLLEASAGTGKTFTIQHLVVRLLLFPHQTPLPLTLPQILVVTFTKKAASELKERIYRQLHQTMEQLKQPVDPAHYLFPIQEAGSKEEASAMRRLQEALFSFESANIGTIHSFCGDMLRRFSPHFWPGDKPDSPQELRQFLSLLFIHSPVVRDYSPFQLQKIFQSDPDHSKLLQHLLEPQDLFGEELSLSHAFPHFCAAMQQLQAEGIVSSKFLADFTAELPHYYAGKESKTRLTEKVHAFAQLLDKKEWTTTDFDHFLRNGAAFLQALHPSLKKVKTKTAPSLHYPTLYATVERLLSPLLAFSTQPKYLLPHLAKLLLPAFARYQAKHPQFRPDDLLKNMQALVQDEKAACAIRSLYQAAIIDEFQDTDPVQWKIFQQLFLGNWGGSGYFVGDPKQSIYSFRKADIYTYLEAGERLGKEAKACLTTNFRSSSCLIEALNALFSQEHLSHFFPLPKKGLSLSCPPAVAASSENCSYLPHVGPLHFWVFSSTQSVESIEERLLFPQIAHALQEIFLQRSSVACLIKDRYQGEKLAQFLEKIGIPYHYPRPPSCATSRFFSGLQALVEAVLDPECIQMARFSPLLPDYPIEDLAFALSRSSLQKVLQKKGWAPFLDQLLRCPWLPDQMSIYQYLLETQGGDAMWEEVQMLEGLLLLRSQQGEFLQSHLLFDDFADWAAAQSTPTQTASCDHALQILTIHASKGLEFDVVFPIGLIRGEKGGENAEETQESDAEKMRLLYVALTRAKKQLFVPYVQGDSSSRRQKSASPMELFAAKYHPSFLSFLEKTPVITHARIEQPAPLSAFVPPPEAESPISLVHPIALSHAFPSYWLTSFSKKQLPYPVDPPEKPERKDRLLKKEEKNRHTLPKGPETGQWIHSLLQKIPLSTWQNLSHLEQAKKMVAPFLARTDLEGWEEVIGQLFLDVLSTELPLPSGPFCLHQLKPGTFYQEMPFLYSGQGGERVQGVVDLCFIEGGKYYLVDWKTNWLGEEDATYAPKNLEQEVEKMGYSLQAQLYQEALQRYFALFPKEEAPSLSCGGTFFLFLRGMQRGSLNGIYTHGS